MMKVPKYEQQVGKEAVTVQPVNQPTISMPGAVRGAFGESQGQAVENLGKVTMQIAGHMQQMAKDEQDIERINRETAYMQDWQDILTNQEEETLDIGGQEVTRPKGLLMRPAMPVLIASSFKKET